MTNSPQTFFKKHCNDPIKVVAFPSPPAIWHDTATITMPHGWSSNAIDRMKGIEVQPNSEGKALAKVREAAWHAQVGPVCLVVHQFKHLMRPFGSLIRPILVSYCAEVDFFSRDHKKIEFCESAEISKLIMQGNYGGCNPATDIAFPEAWEYTRLINRYREKERKYFRPGALYDEQAMARLKVSPGLVKMLFPNENFACNRVLDEYLNICKTSGIVSKDALW